MRYKIVLRTIGFLLLFLGAMMLLPLPFSIYYGSDDYSAFLLSALCCAVSGLLLIWKFKAKEDLRPKEGFAIVSFGWLTLAVFGSLPYILSGSIGSYTDAFFETMSGFTTTGASILTDIEVLPKGILFWRALTNWIGGMGIILLSLAILPFLGVGGMQLFKAEVPGPITDKLRPRITETAKILWSVYVILTMIEAVLLMLAGMDLFDSLCHSLATMATGGFSTKNQSVGYFNNPLIDYIVIFFMILAGTNFTLHYHLLRGKISYYLSNKEFLFFIYVIAGGFVILLFDVLINGHYPFLDSVRLVLFQVVSILTTTGFGTADYEAWSLSSNVILVIMMFAGACAGSTAGGIKLIRIYIIIKFIFGEFIRLLHPQAVVSIKIGEKSIDKNIISNIVGFFIIYMAIAVISVLMMTLLGLDLTTSIGSVAATINNIGPGLGLVGPTKNYAAIPEFGKWVLSFLMLIGRLEIFTVIILFAPSFWRK